jgi:hypothetical protein
MISLRSVFDCRRLLKKRLQPDARTPQKPRVTGSVIACTQMHYSSDYAKPLQLRNAWLPANDMHYDKTEGAARKADLYLQLHIPAGWKQIMPGSGRRTGSQSLLPGPRRPSLLGCKPKGA